MKTLFACLSAAMVFSCASNPCPTSDKAADLFHGTVKAVTVDVTGLVVICGGESRTDSAGVSTFTSHDNSRDVQVLCDPSRISIRRDETEWSGLATQAGVGVNMDDLALPKVPNSSPSQGLSSRQAGTWDRLLASKVVVDTGPDGGRLLHLHDVLFNGASAPVFEVTMSSPAHQE